jgi:hypothetical protein
MYKLLPTYLLAIFSIAKVTAQCTQAPIVPSATCPAAWQKDAGLNVTTYTVPNTPHSRTLRDMMGVNANTNWDNIYQVQAIPNPFKNVATHARSFHHAEKDYRINKPCPNGDCTPYSACADFGAFYQCTPAQHAPVDNIAWNGMDLYRYRYSLWRNDFTKIHAALTLAPAGNLAFDTPHQFPLGWWTSAEWGGGTGTTPNYTNIYTNAKAYAVSFANKMCPNAQNCVVDVLEIGNEPYAYTDPKIYEAIQRGMIDGLRCVYNSDDANTWLMKLLPGAFQGHHAETGATVNGGDKTTYTDYLGTRIPCYLQKYYAGVNVHLYSFQNGANNYNLTEIPESANSDFKYLKNTVKWANTNMTNKKVYLSEFGWDSHTVGETAQMAYIMRTLLIAQRHKLHQTTVFNSTDDTFTGLFSTSGLYNVDGNAAPTTPKKSYTMLQKMLSTMGTTTFLSALQENTNGYAYLMGNASTQKPTHLVVWKPTTINATGTDAHTTTNFTMTLPQGITLGAVTGRTWIDEQMPHAYMNTITTGANNTIMVPVSAVPILIPIVCTNCQLTVSTENAPPENLNTQVSVFPNPIAAGETLHIDALDTELINGAKSYTLYNIVGQKISSAPLTNDNFIMPNVPTGAYMLQINFGDKGMSTHKVMIK